MRRTIIPLLSVYLFLTGISANLLALPPAFSSNKTRTIAEGAFGTSPTASAPATATSSFNLLNGASDPEGGSLVITEFMVDGVTYPAGTTVSIQTATIINEEKVMPGGTPASMYTETRSDSLTINSDGSYTYKGILNWNGTVPLITYTIADTDGETAGRTLSITITPTNDRPVNKYTSYSGAEDGIMYLKNFQFVDPDPDEYGNPDYMVWLRLGNPQGCMLTVAGSGYGVAFTQVSDSTIQMVGKYDSLNAFLKDTATCPIIIPVPDGRSGTGGCLTAKTLRVKCYEIGLPGSGGTPDVSGGDATAPLGWHDNSQVLANITSVRDIVADNIGTITGPVTFNVLTGTGGAMADNFEDAGRVVTSINFAPVTDGATVTLPSGNSIVVNSDGTISFTPSATFSGTDTFNYLVTSPLSGCTENARVTINIETPLPVELLSFSGKQLPNCLIALNWNTGVELKIDRFEIERSRDGTVFNPLQIVPVKGSSNTYTVEVTPSEVNGSMEFYRLRIVSADGTYTFSNIIPVTINCTAPGTIRVLPTVAGEYIDILGVPGGETVYIYNATGTLLAKEKSGDAPIRVNVQHYPSGMYYVRTASGARFPACRFIRP